jgi:tetratricopeptide (TPR) repeat protein
MVRPFRLAALAALVSVFLACGGRAAPHTAASQMRFGVRMAEKGLWSEAIFRFQQAEGLGGGTDPQVLNNLAVASEALGRFEDALGYYRRALELAPGNRELKANYDRFVSFYESYRARAETTPETAAAAPASAEPAADSGTAGPAQMPGEPPTRPGEEPPRPPGVQEPQDASDPPPNDTAALQVPSPVSAGEHAGRRAHQGRTP